MTKPVFIAAALVVGVTAFAPAYLPVNSRRNMFVSKLRTPPLQRHCVERRSRPGRSTSLQMCICIHCKHVTNCSAYHFVEEQHSQPHINTNPTWEPRNGSPTIQVHIRPEANSKAEDELEKMWDEHEEETRLAEEKALIEDKEGDAPLVGSAQYDLSAVNTYEYDVIECDDFVEDNDAWVRNMPEEIRLANPDFVPT